MTNKEALETMCKNCKNYEMCQGTGCNPKNLLSTVLERYNILEKGLLDVKCELNRLIITHEKLFEEAKNIGNK